MSKVVRVHWYKNADPLRDSAPDIMMDRFFEEASNDILCQQKPTKIPYPVTTTLKKVTCPQCEKIVRKRRREHGLDPDLPRRKRVVQDLEEQLEFELSQSRERLSKLEDLPALLERRTAELAAEQERVKELETVLTGLEKELANAGGPARGEARHLAGVVAVTATRELFETRAAALETLRSLLRSEDIDTQLTALDCWLRFESAPRSWTDEA